MGGIGDQKLYEPYYKAIAECCDYAAAKGMGISVKPHGGLNATGPQCRKTIEFVGHKNFRIWYDPGNSFYYSDGKLDPIDDAPSVDGLVIGMSVKDYKHPKDVSVTPGTGQVDFPTVLAKLKAGGFTAGPLIVECLAPGDLPHTLEEARKAGADKIRRINVNVGGLSGVESDCIHFYFDYMKNGNAAEGAELKCTPVPVQLKCRTCNHQFQPVDSAWICPGCQGISLEVLVGNECYVESIEVE
mgnify:CR=1 FL=1